jgi:hypothetical protein
MDTPTTLTTASTMPNPAYSVPVFNTHDRLIHIHQEITDFLHYQLHVQFHATASLPPNTHPAQEQERDMILEFLQEERTCLANLKWLLDMANDNDKELISFYKDSPISNNKNWGQDGWGLLPDWEQ